MNDRRMLPPPPIVLTFAASDPSGGAGIQADLMTLAANGCHPLTVLTGLTVQDTVGVTKILPFGSGWISEQARIVLADMPVNAFKIGMLGNIGNIEAIVEILAEHPDVPLVFDPVLASGRGDAFADKQMIAAIQELLLPRTTVLTPNSLEARRLAARSQEAECDIPLPVCAERLVEFGCQYVLLTGTHEDTPLVTNDLYDRRGLVRSDRWERLSGSYHGSGCTLASAVAANLAHGLGVDEAVREAQEYTWQALAAGFLPGKGQFIPDRFFRTSHQEAIPKIPGEPA